MNIIIGNKYPNMFGLFMRINGIALYPFIFIRPDSTTTIINHESIHIKQQAELLVLPFYLWYVTEWFIRLFFKGNAYRNISFEREAYENSNNLGYLKTRKLFSFLKYL